jgi:hypothetical protein
VKRFWQSVSLGVLLLLLHGVAGAGEPTARATVDSTAFLVGDWIHVHIALTHPRGVALLPVIGDSLEGFAVLDRGTVAATGDTSSATELVVARYDSGSWTLPPIPFQYVLPGDTIPRTVFTNPLMVTVRTVAVDTTKDFRDLKPPMSVPISLAEITLYAGILLVVAGAGYLLYRWWKKRATRATGQEREAPLRPAHVIAFEELGALKEKKLWQKGLVKEYYSEATEILRRYVENRYQIKALEETTDEILSGLGKIKLAGDLLRSIEKVLRRADLVKFAKLRPDVPEHEEVMTVAYDVVERTKIVVMTPVDHPSTAAGPQRGS